MFFSFYLLHLQCNTMCKNTTNYNHYIMGRVTSSTASAKKSTAKTGKTSTPKIKFRRKTTKELKAMRVSVYEYLIP